MNAKIFLSAVLAIMSVPVLAQTITLVCVEEESATPPLGEHTVEVNLQEKTIKWNDGVIPELQVTPNELYLKNERNRRMFEVRISRLTLKYHTVHQGRNSRGQWYDISSSGQCRKAEKQI
ncbi:MULTISPECIES: hypothetical protein [Janthinobacterium]|uniref:hypothetical protein n=1 Tax=Janthinobacterium TaxID=29580 RepID=UPI000563F335|nr:hypothetical protein [Janthinobacterium sp. RA13]